MVQRRVLQCRLCRNKEKCLKPGLKCNDRWSSSTVQRKRVPESWNSNRETTSSSVQVVRRNWQKLLCGRPQWTKRISTPVPTLKSYTFGRRLKTLSFRTTINSIRRHCGVSAIPAPSANARTCTCTCPVMGWLSRALAVLLMPMSLTEFLQTVLELHRRI